MTNGHTPNRWIADGSVLGARLALIRQRMGWNMKQAARECGIPGATWRQWELGAKPGDVERLRKIADRTGCDLAWLAFGEIRQAVA